MLSAFGLRRRQVAHALAPLSAAGRDGMAGSIAAGGSGHFPTDWMPSGGCHLRRVSGRVKV
jgi:hypothetical protein